MIPRKLAFPDSFMGSESMGRAGHSQLAAMAIDLPQVLITNVDADPKSSWPRILFTKTENQYLHLKTQI